jgi:hypothetical protein
MRKALGWYVRKAFFWVMASQNIPSQSCTHLLRILLVMVVLVMVVVIKEVCDLMLFPRTSRHLWLLDYCNIQSLGCYQTIQALPLLLMPASLKHPSSSSFAFCEAPLSALGNTRVGFLGQTGVQNWVCWAKLGSKLRLLGQSGVQTAFSQLMQKMKGIFLKKFRKSVPF